MLTPKEAALIKSAYSKHQETKRCALALRHQLERIHQEQTMRPLADSIDAEGASLGRLLDLVRRREPELPDPMDPDDAREAVRETQWGCGQ